MPDPDRLVAGLLAHFGSPGYTPPLLPAVAIEVMNLSKRPSAGPRELAAVLQQDSLLAARLLQRVGSPVYARGQPIRSLRDAVAHLGLRELNNLVLEVALNLRVFRAPSFAEPMRRLQRHSLGTAHIARRLTRPTSFDAEFAFLCGLLHDVGFAAMLIALGDVRPPRRPPSLDALWPALHDGHQAASRRLIELWSLPAEIGWICGAHHTLEVSGLPHPIAAAVCVAERIASDRGLGIMPRDADGWRAVDTTPEPRVQAALDLLALSEGAWKRIGEEVTATLDQL